MYEFLIKEYINRMTLGEIKAFAQKEGITLTDKETEILYDYIKNHWRTFLYGNPRKLLDEIKEKVEPLTYNKIENLYTTLKKKIN